MTDLPFSPAKTLETWPEICDMHPGAPAIAFCTQCRAFLCRDCRHVDRYGLAVCTRCEERAAQSRAGGAASLANLLPWFLRTTRALLLHPGRFIRKLELRAPIGRAVGFGLFWGTVGILAILAWMYLTVDDPLAELAAEYGVPTRTYELMFIAFVPIAAILNLVTYGLLLRLGTVLVGRGQLFRYRHYVALIGYASVAYVFLVVPVGIGLLGRVVALGSTPTIAFHVAQLLEVGYIIVFCGQALYRNHGLSHVQTFIATVPLALGVLLLELHNPL